MAYKIKIKHNIEGEQIPLHLKYDSDDNFPEIPIVLTNEEQTIQLTGWNPGENGLDSEKIKIREKQYVNNDKIYDIVSVSISINGEPDTAAPDVIEDNINQEIQTNPESQNNQQGVINAYNSSYSTGSYNQSIGEQICADESKHFYDISYDIRHTSYNTRYYTDEEFMSEYGPIQEGAFLVRKSSTGYGGRISYGSVYYSGILLEANTQYVRFKIWKKTTVVSQSINEEGRKKGVTTYGYLGREHRCCTVDLKIPDNTDTVVRIYDGPDENAEVLSITFAPDYTEASSSYKPAKGDIYVDGTKVCNQEEFVRVRLEKNRQYIITADNISFDGMTDWQTLGNHYVTMPLYSDNILKIVIFNDNHDHFIYPNLYQQAKQNRWGLPASLFTSQTNQD